jgi:hypothetical protein
MSEDWLLKLLKEMVKNKYCMTDLNKIKIYRDKSSLTQFNFTILINKSVFEDILSEDEKGMLWLEESDKE